MNLKFIRKGVIAISLAGAVLIPVQQIAAANGVDLLGTSKQEQVTQIDENCLVNAIAEIQKEDSAEKTIKIASIEEINFNDKLAGKVFLQGADGYALVVAEPTEGSNWVGKVYENSLVKIKTRGETWSEIESGNIVGYVKTAELITGKDAITKAKEILAAEYPERNLFTLKDDEIEEVFTVGETRGEELKRLEAEEAARIAAEQARIAAVKEAIRRKGESVVQYAEQFLGNPYVYGGTSLTRGTDCSGFVKSVYAYFGVSLPHSSYGMKSVGYGVSYGEMQPGDIVCYPGHVGIYAGNGKIVNAIDENKGIGMSNVNYTTIITIRRIF